MMENFRKKQPTDFLTTGQFTVLNQLLCRKYGLSFSAFFGAIVTKYQALSMSTKFRNQKNFEFWYTGYDTQQDIGMSYYMRKKCIRIGVELQLWTCETKHNPAFKGSCNMLDHFLLNWGNIALLFRDLKMKADNPRAEAETQKAAIEEEIEELEKVPENDIQVTDAEIEEFAQAMSTQKGIRNQDSYRLTILQKCMKKDRKTMEKLMLFLRGQKNKVSSSIPRREYEHLIFAYFYHENRKYYISEVLLKDEKIIILGIGLDHENRISITVPLEKLEEFEKNNLFKME